MSKKKALSVIGKIVKITAIVAVSLGILVGGAFAVTNGIVVVTGNARIVSAERAAKLEDVDCILILGCRVYSNEPSVMLRDRVMQGVELYNLGASETLFMTGDSRDRYYDETGVMSRLAEENGVPTENIVTDRYGLSTYDSIFRAAKVYGYKKVIIVTQEYHLTRALYIAKQFGMNAYGVASDTREYKDQLKRDVREIAARSKDFLYCILKPEPEYGREK